MSLRLRQSDDGFATRLRTFLEARRVGDGSLNREVTEIVTQIRQRGNEALYAYTHQFDGFDLSSVGLTLGPSDIARARDACDAADLEALALAAQRIEDYHKRQIPKDSSYQDACGVKITTRWKPIRSVGIYVPGGTAAYPSSVLMNAIPAKAVGVERIAMMVPTPGGVVNPHVLAAAHLVGVDDIYRIGGAQAVAALAYGTQTIAAVDKIVGPGNAYVAEAKRQVFGQVGIDMIAGPSEILVVADSTNAPDWIAIDLLSQAEHDVCAQAILITDSEAFADAVDQALERHLATLPRAEIARRSWEDHGAFILVEKINEAVDIVDMIAPEHLEVAIKDAQAFAARVRHAGAIFLGGYTPEAIGDYVAGPNHVLPTSGSARFSSGLGVTDFLLRSSCVQCDATSLNAIGPTARHLAQVEGLDAHARSIDVRLGMAEAGKT